MMLGGISLTGKTRFDIISDNLKVKRCLDEILESVAVHNLNPVLSVSIICF